MNKIVVKAREFAVKAHGDQKYGKLPYEYHLQQVVSTLMLWGDYNSEEITDIHLAVGWLHDVLEDTSTTFTTLNNTFGLKVAEPVFLLTKGTLDYEKYIYEIRQNPVAKVVKKADTVANLQASILSANSRRINKYSKQLALLTEGD